MKAKTALNALVTIVFIAAAADTVSADETAEARVSENRFFSAEARERSVPDSVSNDEYGADEQGRRTRPAAAGRDRSLAAVGDIPNVDFWFYSADVELFADEDRDGYYSGIDLLFDADTVFARADVYAVAYLSRDGGPWLEYAATEDFVIHGTSAGDEFSIVTELLAGYPVGDYDLLIELYDAWDGTFLADIGPADTSELSFLPLEDAERDTPVVESRVTVSSTSGGGAADPATLAVLFGLIALVIARRRQSLPLRADQ